jgi:hypothetical protein
MSYKGERVAGGPGFEPEMPESESGVLPLNYPPSASAAQKSQRKAEEMAL